ncbi:MAG: hypothetical protein KKA05_00455 [Alphaproteobacteria bacterium]|nr:hypothetical protein [Alphaproteobacteria bacterium]MBU0859743.1 hypothetical protein [Alphaproteobacteria bacterium]
MKINDVYNKHAASLLRAAQAGRPFAALTYGPNCADSHFRTFADKDAASAFLAANTPAGSGIGGVIAETDVKRKTAIGFTIPTVTGYKSFA